MAHSCLLLSGNKLRLRRLLPITPYHDYAQEAPNNGGTEQYQDNWYPDCPDTRREEIMEGMPRVDERLSQGTH